MGVDARNEGGGTTRMMPVMMIKPSAVAALHRFPLLRRAGLFEGGALASDDSHSVFVVGGGE